MIISAIEKANIVRVNGDKPEVVVLPRWEQCEPDAPVLSAIWRDDQGRVKFERFFTRENLEDANIAGHIFLAKDSEGMDIFTFELFTVTPLAI